jgi:hypothetical protein
VAGNIPRLAVPALEPEDVIRHLGKGVQHWKGGYSAQSLATLWHRANDYPPRVRKMLETSPVFRRATLVDGFFERSTELGDGAHPSQTDLLTIARVADRLAIIAIEGKADESFGPLVDAWLKKKGRRKARLDLLRDILGTTVTDVTLRYQLFHRSAAAAIEAERYCANKALLLVHSFSTKQSGLSDYKRFLEALGVADQGVAEHIVGPVRCTVHGRGIDLYFGRVTDEADHADFWPRLRAHAKESADHATAVAKWIEKRS